MSNQESYNLSDEVIAHVAKLLQIAILSGTDVVDHLRMIRLDIDADGVNGLVLNKEYTKIGDSNIEKMLSEIKNYKDNFDV
tara:strand:+ start:729 stop:971 length:243 start_codon:yes stop_codon:yes gene_type:complete